MKRGYRILLIVMAVLILFWITFHYRSELICIIKNDFPENYSIDNVAIYNYRSTMVGGYYISIHGDGSAYYLNSLHPEGNEIPIAKSGILSQEKLKELINLFKRNNFFCLREKYGARGLFSLTDLETDFVSLTVGGLTRNVEDYGRNSPSSFREIVDELKSSVSDLPKISPDEHEGFCEVMTSGYNEKTGYNVTMSNCLWLINQSNFS